MFVDLVSLFRLRDGTKLNSFCDYAAVTVVYNFVWAAPLVDCFYENAPPPADLFGELVNW